MDTFLDFDKNVKNVFKNVQKRTYSFTGHLITPTFNTELTRMWANAQRDGRPAEYRWRPMFNVAKFG